MNPVDPQEMDLIDLEAFVRVNDTLHAPDGIAARERLLRSPCFSVRRLPLPGNSLCYQHVGRDAQALMQSADHG